MMEVWKFIPGFVGYYKVSNLGRILSVERLIESGGKKAHIRKIKERILKPSLSNGYCSHVLWVDHKQTTVRAHSAVASAFIGDRPCGMYVCHINGDRRDNRLENLYYGTPQQNCDDARRHGTMPSGEACGAAKLKVTDVAAIRAKSGYVTQKQICEEFGISQAQASRVINGIHWQNVGIQ